jgi:hypothetical protein
MGSCGQATFCAAKLIRVRIRRETFILETEWACGLSDESTITFKPHDRRHRSSFLQSYKQARRITILCIDGTRAVDLRMI